MLSAHHEYVLHLTSVLVHQEDHLIQIPVYPRQATCVPVRDGFDCAGNLSGPGDHVHCPPRTDLGGYWALWQRFLALLAACAVALWGVAHVIPARHVLAGFAPISVDNRRVVLQEWLVEAVTLWTIAALVVVSTVVGGGASQVTSWVCRVGASLLVVLAVVTALTGARTKDI